MDNIYINEIKYKGTIKELITILNNSIYPVDSYVILIVIDTINDIWFEQFSELILYRNHNVPSLKIVVDISRCNSMEYVRSQLLELIRYDDIITGS